MENTVDFLSKIKCETVISVWNVNLTFPNYNKVKLYFSTNTKQWIMIDLKCTKWCQRSWIFDWIKARKYQVSEKIWKCFKEVLFLEWNV